jgi:8-oxo-dGTP pyrophosphatase MutT (NUDIX family)
MEDGEQSIQAAKRELREELGIEAGECIELLSGIVARCKKRQSRQ